MFTIEKSIVIDEPVETVFAYATDPNHLPEYYTDVREVKDLRRLPNGGYACTLLPVELSVETIEFVPNERTALRGTACGGMDDITLTTTFERLASDRTHVTHREEHAFRGGFFGRLGEKPAAKYFDHAAEMSVAVLKARVEAKAPVSTPS